MPRRNDISKILILGSGPIVIGQAAEFDYSGVQACKVLREEGYEVVLVNSNPATIMTDPEFADATYIEPLLPGPVAQVIERERPDALLATLGGQTGLNIAKALHDDGTLERFEVELIGANYNAIACAEDRELVGKKPVWGICLGHQLLCRAVGLETFKLPFGHRGANHPVKDLQTGRVQITSQNHGFAALGPDGARTIAADEPVRWETDFGAAALSHVNLYDRTVEGLELLEVPGGTVQYHPEAAPGPHDAGSLFGEFRELMGSGAA